MALDIFQNQTTDADVEAKVSDNGIIQVDISGVLDGADVITSYLNDDDVVTIVRDCSWMSSKSDVLDNSDGSTKYIQKRNLKFSIVNAGASTNISLFVTHETGDIEKI